MQHQVSKHVSVKVAICLAKPLFLFLFGVFAACASSISLQAKDLSVVASIPPIHSLAASVMQGRGTPYLLVPGRASPHTYRLKPSDAAALEKADILFWIGPQLEGFLKKPLQTLAHNADAVSLIDVASLNRRSPRFGGDHGHRHTHDAAAVDPHIWLDPQNAMIIVRTMADIMATADPGHSTLYQTNATRLTEQILEYQSDTEAHLTPLRQRPFAVFHDAFQYFEHRFGLQATTAIVLNPDIGAGARRISQLRQKLKQAGIVCLFSEPQFSRRLLDLVNEDIDAKVMTMDPVGATFDPGPGLYLKLLMSVRDKFHQCLN